MNVFTALKNSLAVLGIESEISEPAHPDGLWYLNSNYCGAYVSISWSRQRNYQIAFTRDPEEPNKCAPMETYTDRWEALNRVLAILGGQW